MESFDAVHAVLGNEACDLDSAVSAVVYAYYLHTSVVYTLGDFCQSVDMH